MYMYQLYQTYSNSTLISIFSLGYPQSAINWLVKHFFLTGPGVILVIKMVVLFYCNRAAMGLLFNVE